MKKAPEQESRTRFHHDWPFLTKIRLPLVVRAPTILLFRLTLEVSYLRIVVFVILAQLECQHSFLGISTRNFFREFSTRKRFDHVGRSIINLLLGAGPCLCFHIVIVSIDLFFNANRVQTRVFFVAFLFVAPTSIIIRKDEKISFQEERCSCFHGPFPCNPCQRAVRVLSCWFLICISIRPKHLIRSSSCTEA